MTSRIPQYVATRMINWMLISNPPPPRDPNDDEEDAEEGEEDQGEEPPVVREPDE